uniref:CLIP domain-containing serine protease n=1 Tax=Manduca sexta TaxID=7130 RepID=Q5MPB3_MANSE|nr:hemolymph proteinase 21 [Manduca sexta]
MLREVLLVALCIVVRAADENETCNMKNGEVGICKNIRNCPSALENLRKRIQPQLCGFDKSDPIVCCVESVTTPAPTQPPIATTTKRPQVTTTTEYEPPLYEYETVDRQGSGCPPIDANLTSPKIGRKAWDKCLEYQEKLVYPCEKSFSLSLNDAMERKVKCHNNADDLIIGGQNASRNEFPHMALLGYGEEPDVQWLCGGTLISENFILTAGHCISSRDINLTYVYLGALARSEVTDPSKQYRIKKIHKHPEFAPPVRYNDIALVELERNVPLDEWLKPACLHMGDETADDRVWATGWGLTEYKASSGANILQKVVLNKFSTFECILQYPPHRLMSQGFDVNSQMCYGDRSQSKDTCQGDSGGPLQIKHKKINCMWLIIGVTSFGKACGFIGEPGIYTKVSHYIPWIESVVWP